MPSAAAWTQRHGSSWHLLGIDRLLLAVALCVGLWPASVQTFAVPRGAAAGALAAPARAPWVACRGPRCGSGAQPTLAAAPAAPSTPGACLAAAATACALAAALHWQSGPGRSAAPRTQRHGWGDDVAFHEASVKSNVEAADGLRLITVDAPADVSTPFTKAGQFVQAKPAADAKPSFYAISSPPGGGALEFLIKEAESNTWLTDAQSGDTMQMSAAMGKGFNLASEAWAATQVSQVGLFATGSGIAPMRALIESGALAGKACRLYFGARTEAAMPYADRFKTWRDRGIEVVPVLSKGGDGWEGRSGYVQDALREDEERGEGFVLAARHGALLCGQKEMVAAVREVYAGLGVPEDRTLLNF